MSKIRCPQCRGVKKCNGMGHVYGDCGMCNATGLIETRVKVEPVVSQPVIDIIEQVSNAVVEPVKEVEQKIDGKRAVFKRKKG